MFGAPDTIPNCPKLLPDVFAWWLADAMMRCAFHSSLLIAYYFLQLRSVQHATLLVVALILPHDHHELDIGRQPARRGRIAVE
jgi:hypothetical protein